MNILPKEKIPKNRLPIYFCNAIITIQETKRNKKTTYNIEFKKVVLKGITLKDLENKMIEKANKKQFHLFTKTQLKTSKIICAKIEILKFLSFGVFE